MFICGVIQLVYRVTRTFDNEDLMYLTHLYSTLPSKFYKKDLTLFNTERRDVPNLDDGGWSKIISKQIVDSKKYIPKRQYFLKYTYNSFCIIHQDNPSAVKETSITLIDKSSDLEGGEIYIRSPVYENDLREGIVRNHPQEKGNVLRIGEDIVPETIAQNVGETVWYPIGTYHGVTKVKKGYRIVLVTWFGEYNEKDQIYKETV